MCHKTKQNGKLDSCIKSTTQTTEVMKYHETVHYINAYSLLAQFLTDLVTLFSTALQILAIKFFAVA
jgi:hypothetical protein